MSGILRIAFKLLVNDRGKFAALLVGITFAVLLMVMVTSMFAGVMRRASATVINTGSGIWVMDRAVNTVANNIPLPDYVLAAVRSIEGVKYAVPIFTGSALAKLPNGDYQAVSIIGLDDSSLTGRPELIEGHIEDIYADNAFIVVKDSEYQKLGSPHVGAEFEVNDHRGVIVGVGRVASAGLFGIPTLYTTYGRAVQDLPSTRFTMSYVLVEPKTPKDIASITSQVAALGYLALTKDQFIQRTSAFYKYQTGVGINIMLMTVISFIVGLSISGQTFYTFILENLDKFGALKAIGARSRELIAMILFQAAFTGLTGYGLGVGLCSLLIAAAKMRLPSYAATVTFFNLGVAFVMVLIITGVASYTGIRRVIHIEPFDVFRS
ncbi:MAG: ABC transporter permease [Proteobacteria bacterium]|nr:ABC transporter permease [Pseudomonadota bacterium]